MLLSHHYQFHRVVSIKLFRNFSDYSQIYALILAELNIIILFYQMYLLLYILLQVKINTIHLRKTNILDLFTAING